MLASIPPCVQYAERTALDVKRRASRSVAVPVRPVRGGTVRPLGLVLRLVGELLLIGFMITPVVVMAVALERFITRGILVGVLKG